MGNNNIITRAIPTVLLASLLLFSQGSFANTNLHIYKTGTKFVLTATWWGLSATGTMEVLGTAKFRGKDTILIRSQVTKLGGFLGFIVRFLRIYRESNTFDSYIDPDTRMPVRYEVYKLDDGFKKLTEDVYFDRRLNRIILLSDNSMIINNPAPDTLDTFSSFLNLLYRFNTERLFTGKRFYVNNYAYKKISKIEVEVSGYKVVNGKPVYMMEIKELPDVFKYPASVTFEVTEDKRGFKLPTRGKCIIDVPILGNITVNGKLEELRITG